MSENSDVNDAVLDAARAAFHAKGYVKTSVRGIAAAAGVAPEMVRRYYGSKDQLFAAAMLLPFDPAKAVPQILAPGLEGMGARLVRAMLETLRDEETREDLLALVQAGTSASRAAAGVREFIEQAVVDRVASVIGVPDARLRANLISAYLIGVGVNRYIVKIDPLASMSDDDVVRLVAPTIQDWLTPTKPLPGS